MIAAARSNTPAHACLSMLVWNRVHQYLDRRFICIWASQLTSCWCRGSTCI